MLAAMLRGGEFVGRGAGDHLLGGGVDEGHGAFGEVAAVGGLPLVVLVDEHGSDEADDRVVVGENSNDIRASLDLLVDPFEPPTWRFDFATK